MCQHLFYLNIFQYLIFIYYKFWYSYWHDSHTFSNRRIKPDKEKLSAYECGFDAFDDARGRFDVRFYLVAILFIIFDLEVAFLFPWAVSFGKTGYVWFLVYDNFSCFSLTVGFIYEWKKGALEWE